MSANISAGPVEGLWLGLDTGGTFTDAVLLAGGRRVIASAKALTTPWNLAIGIGKANRAVLEELPSDARRGDVSLVECGLDAMRRLRDATSHSDLQGIGSLRQKRDTQA